MISPLQLAVLSCLLLGFRHGFDYDHLAAITDITSVQRSWREGMFLGVLYALGHALTVAVLGVAVLLLHVTIPPRLDAVGERLVGITLIALAAYVLLALRRSPTSHSHVQRSRIALLVSGARYAYWRMRSFRNRDLPAPGPFSFRYDRGSVFVVGIIHGLGAETPSQLLLFLLAANLGGTEKGIVGLLAFLGGLLLMNTLMTASASGLFAGSRARPGLRTGLNVLTAVYSAAVGSVFLLGWSDRLPALVR